MVGSTLFSSLLSTPIGQLVSVDWNDNSNDHREERDTREMSRRDQRIDVTSQGDHTSEGFLQSLFTKGRRETNKKGQKKGKKKQQKGKHRKRETNQKEHTHRNKRSSHPHAIRPMSALLPSRSLCLSLLGVPVVSFDSSVSAVDSSPGRVRSQPRRDIDRREEETRPHWRLGCDVSLQANGIVRLA